MITKEGVAHPAQPALVQLNINHEGTAKAECAPGADLVILTATITPPGGVPSLLRTDPKARLKDYQDALAFYLSLPREQVGKILFIDNSQSDMSSLADLVASRNEQPRVCLHTFAGLDHPAAYGRGYGEFKLLDYALDHLHELAPEWNHPDTRIWKITGRYQVRNLSHLIRTAPRCELYCDLKNRPQPWMDLRIFRTTLRGYRRFFYNIRERLREDLSHQSPETYFRHHIGHLLANEPGNIIPRLRIEPYVDGLRGCDNRNYASGKNKMKFLVRSVMRTIAPSLWI